MKAKILVWFSGVMFGIGFTILTDGAAIGAVPILLSVLVFASSTSMDRTEKLLATLKNP